ncbi:MAG: thiamine diphosphokinase [Bacilli bacterium]|nr:thiamine diphosphokinase [Bacilli bacterium]MDD7315785.1 thiamine diphosphokinase [Bacilli bacterium]MDY4052357.1 thiamine diphosphokinase [Bacilli bacterium]
MRYIIVGKSPNESFQKIYIHQENDFLIGLDEGALKIIEKGYKLNEVWGDFDNKEKLQKISKYCSNIHLYPTKKNQTDLELVLMNIKTNDEIVIYDVTGGRLDHEIINLLLLRKYHNLKLKIRDNYNEIIYLSTKGNYTFSKDEFNYISIITLDQATISIIKGEYLLDKTTITKNDTYTTSNTFVDEEFSIELFSGEIFIIKSI